MLKPTILRLHRVALVAAAAVVLLMTNAAAAEARQAQDILPGNLPAQAPRQVFSDDLTVVSGEVIDDSVVVYSGDVDVESGGRIAGTLVVMSGDVEIEEGGSVDGDVTAYSGDVMIDGRVGGSLSAMSGDVELGNAARVEGDISVLSGSIRRAEGAFIGGNVVQTPGIRVPGMPVPPRIDGLPEAPRTSFFAQVLGLLARLIGAVLLTALVAAIAGVVSSVWPERVAQTRSTLLAQRPLSFVVGLFSNLTLLFVIGLLSITVCLLPIALLPLLALLAVNLVGWTVASQIVGERVVKSLNQEVQPVLVVAVGALLLTGVATLLWALGGCFRPIGFLFTLGVSSFGTGAILVPWLNRRGSASTETGEPEGDVSGSETAVVTEPDRGTAVDLAAAPVEEPAASGHADVKPDAVGEAEVVQPASEPTPETVAEAAPEADDEFTQIRGVGPVLEGKLKAAGIRTYAQLAAATPEEVGEIVGWSADRVVRSEIRDQAQRLAEGS